MISENIRKYRKAKNLSQDELAEMLNVSRQSISLWENGQTQPTLDNVVALARAFGVSTDALLVSSDDEYSSIPRDMTEEPVAPKKKVNLVPVLAVLGVAAGFILIMRILMPDMMPDWMFAHRDKPEESVAESVTESQEETSTEPEESLESLEESEAESKVESKAESKVESKTESKAESKKTESKAESKKTESKAESKSSSPDLSKLYATLKAYVIAHGSTKGDYSVMKAYASTYGGNYEDDFNLWYWGDTDTVEFSLHVGIDSETALAVYLQIPKTPNGSYTYISSYYYRSDGYPICEAKGSIPAATFTRSYPLTSKSYTGDKSAQTEFMELSRKELCELLDCMKSFLAKNKTGYSFMDLGFKAYK